MNIEELRKEAETGSLVSQTILGICYLDGIKVDVDYDKAFRLLSASVERRVPRAMANLARMYAAGLGVQRDMSEAVRLYEAAAKAGEFFAQIALGRIYHDGVGVPKNDAAARKWYSVAAAWDGRIADCEELREAKERSIPPSRRRPQGHATGKGLKKRTSSSKVRSPKRRK